MVAQVYECFVFRFVFHLFISPKDSFSAGNRLAYCL